MKPPRPAYPHPQPNQIGAPHRAAASDARGRFALSRVLTRTWEQIAKAIAAQYGFSIRPKRSSR